MSVDNPAQNLNTVKLIEVVKKHGYWLVVLHYRDKGEGKNPFIQESYHRQREAVAAAMAMGRWIAETQGFPIQLHIKGRSGKIRDSRTYGKDPEKYKG